MTAYPQIKLFGTPAIIRGEQPVTGFISNKAVAAIYFIAASAQTQGRALLATLLWTNSTDTYAKKNLRNVLSNLRDLLGDVLEITRETVSLPPPLYETVDNNRFLRLARLRLDPGYPLRFRCDHGKTGVALVPVVHACGAGGGGDLMMPFQTAS